VPQLAPERVALRLPARQVAHEAVLVAREPGRDERGLDRRRAREHRDRDPTLERGGDQASAGIVDPWQPRIGYERHPLARGEPGQQLLGAGGLVVLVVAEEPAASR